MTTGYAPATILQTETPPPDLDVATARQRRHWIAAWLFVMAAMVFAMVVLGGVTRLTHSGLSMVEWRPVTGWLPPLAEAEWQAVFDKYKQFPEYKEINAGMTLAEFKGIFWLEFLHRLWGRIIGLAFFLPFVFFLAKGWVGRPLAWRLALLFVLGGLQGGMGWFMVKSGLVDRPDVSQYRLAAHLCLAIVIYGLLLWTAFGLRLEPEPVAERLRGLRRGAGFLTAWIFLTIFSGALVAGLDAGLTFNTFPLMDGDFVPDGAFEMTPLYLNFFENIATVQFDHRILAELTFVATLAFWWLARRRGVDGRRRSAVNALAAVAVAQVCLGIATLLTVVPVSLGALHQAGAVVFFGCAVWVFWEFRAADA